MKIRKCKGMRDLTPADMERFRTVEQTCRDRFTAWGYREVRTPTLEHLHLFTSAGTLTPGQLGKVYSFLDWDGWSGERVVLRPDGTIPVARLYTESSPGEPARLFYAANVFMFEDEPERARERWQCGGELIGTGSPAADAELVKLSLDILESLGIGDVEIRLSHAGIIRALVEKLEINPEERQRIFDRILDGDSDALAEVGQKDPELRQALEPLVYHTGQSRGFLENLRAVLTPELADLEPCLEDFSAAVAALDELGIDYTINIASGAGFEYYTGIIFQLFAGDRKVGGGGRYDALIAAMGGGDVPAAGFALYLTTLLALGAPGSGDGGPEKRVVVRGNSIKPVFSAAVDIRRAGYIAELGPAAGNEIPVLDVNDNEFSLSKTDDDIIITCATIDEVVSRLEELWPSR